MIRLDIFSDPVCPWCYIGKAHLDRALANHPGHPFTIFWHPFQLNPEMPAGGLPKRAYLEAKFGGAAKVDAMLDRLREVASAAGVPFDPDLAPMMPNTLDAHRLVHWAGFDGLQSEIKDRLMRAYWLQCRDIGDRATLADIAAEAGINRVVTLRLLQSDADADDIRARDADARTKGVAAVPTFLVAQRYVVSGAQPPELWAKVIAELTAPPESQLN